MTGQKKRFEDIKHSVAWPIVGEGEGRLCGGHDLTDLDTTGGDDPVGFGFEFGVVQCIFCNR